jgi:mutator family transposase
MTSKTISDSERDPSQSAGSAQSQTRAAVDRLAGVLTPEALEDALKGLEPEEITGPGGLLTQLAGRVIETALGAELTEHLGHPPGGVTQGPNVRNGAGRKTVKTELGAVEVRTPRDRDGSFEPALVATRRRGLAGRGRSSRGSRATCCAGPACSASSTGPCAPPAPCAGDSSPYPARGRAPLGAGRCTFPPAGAVQTAFAGAHPRPRAACGRLTASLRHPTRAARSGQLMMSAHGPGTDQTGRNASIARRRKTPPAPAGVKRSHPRRSRRPPAPALAENSASEDRRLALHGLS